MSSERDWRTAWNLKTVCSAILRLLYHFKWHPLSRCQKRLLCTLSTDLQPRPRTAAFFPPKDSKKFLRPEVFLFDAIKSDFLALGVHRDIVVNVVLPLDDVAVFYKWWQLYPVRRCPRCRDQDPHSSGLTMENVEAGHRRVLLTTRAAYSVP